SDLTSRSNASGEPVYGRETSSLSSLPFSCTKSTCVTVARRSSLALFSFAKLISTLPGAPSTDETTSRATLSSEARTRTAARSLTSKTYSFMVEPHTHCLTLSHSMPWFGHTVQNRDTRGNVWTTMLHISNGRYGLTHQRALSATTSLLVLGSRSPAG